MAVKVYNLFHEQRYFQLLQMQRLMQDMKDQCTRIIDHVPPLDPQAVMIWRNIRQGISAGVDNLKHMAKVESDLNPKLLKVKNAPAPDATKGRWDRPTLDPTYKGRFFTIPELTTILKITKSGLYWMINNGKLPTPYRIGRRRSVWREDELKLHGVKIPKNFTKSKDG